MGKKWKKIYSYYDDPYQCFNNPRIEGKLPDCLTKREEFAVAHRPNDVFAFCGPACGKHLYWRNWQCILGGDDFSITLEEVYEKQTGRISEIDEYIAVEEILDDRLAELEDSLRGAEEAARRAGFTIKRKNDG